MDYVAFDDASGKFAAISPDEIQAGKRAIDLLKRMTKDDPFIEGDTSKACYFCGDTVEHFKDCPYLLAKQLLEEIDNGRPQTKIP